MFLTSTYSFFLFFFLFFFFSFLLWSSSGISREVVSALNSRADVTSLLVIVFTCFLGSPFVLTGPVHRKTWVFIFLHRLQIRHSKILLILARPLPIGYFTFYYFSFFLIFNRMDAWSLMRGDAFIHFVSGSRRVNIRLGVLLLILKSPHIPKISTLLYKKRYRDLSRIYQKRNEPSMKHKFSLKLLQVSLGLQVLQNILAVLKHCCGLNGFDSFPDL